MRRWTTDALSRERESKWLRHSYNTITSFENLLVSWQEFLVGKRKRADVAEFSLNLMDNILAIHQGLVNKTYTHSLYVAFKVNDPKPRDIHKASVADRLLHHAIYRVLYPIFDRQFIFDSYSCRVDKGTHRAMNRFRDFGRKVSRKNTRTCWVLKCDIRKFFASINHQILKNILSRTIGDKNTMWLLDQIIDSFCAKGVLGIGLPLGNLTSQLYINIYLNELDQFVKRILKSKRYIRYADDFVILSSDKEELEKLLPQIRDFLNRELKLNLHPDKVYIRTLASGVDFLGFVHFPDHRVIRTTTKRRMYRKMLRNQKEGSYQSYIGLLQHGNGWKVKQALDLLNN